MLSERLTALYAERDGLLVEGGDTAALQVEILKLRRRIRDRQFKAGEILGDGRYKLLRPLGIGGFAEVWKAFDTREQRVVALKALHSQHGRDASKCERFLRGARKMSNLDHPAIVRVLGDVPLFKELVPDDDVFFVMEYLEGGDLRAAVRGGALDRAAARAAIFELGDALSHAHARELIHRDVKPANILLTGDGRAKLTDFDLVRAADTTGGTRTQAMGSFVYAAPEVMRDAKKADVRADVFGLAMTAVFVLHGADLPVDALFDTAEFLEDEVETTDGVREVLLRGLARKPKQRTATVEEFCAELRDALAPPRPVEAPPAPVTPQSRSHRPRLSGRSVDLEALFTKIETKDGLVDLWREIPAGELVKDGKVNTVIVAPFQMAVVPVTNAQYLAFKKEFKLRSQRSVSGDELLRHPVVDVSSNDATGFCTWLAEQFDWAKGARLPTEAEWEYACRAGSTTKYWSGDTERDLAQVGWYKENSGSRTHAVGEKEPNPWGLYDVHGNVWEWTLSPRISDYEGRSGIRHDPSDPESPDLAAGVAIRVIRGGSFEDTADRCRSAYRSFGSPWFVLLDQGFRVVVPVPRAGH